MYSNTCCPTWTGVKAPGTMGPTLSSSDTGSVVGVGVPVVGVPVVGVPGVGVLVVGVVRGLAAGESSPLEHPVARQRAIRTVTVLSFMGTSSAAPAAAHAS